MSPLIVLETPGVYGLKPRFQALLRPLVRGLAGIGVRANQVTVFACVLSVALGVFLLTSQDPHLFALLPAVLLVRRGRDAGARVRPGDETWRVLE
jgi:CDP-diacylglycerol--glycerol-3-phosphate 3-phosphatidyltransferase